MTAVLRVIGRAFSCTVWVKYGAIECYIRGMVTYSNYHVLKGAKALYAYLNSVPLIMGWMQRG
jgi:mRNA-degrading endonuclease HigB of HigAB toxin-antitoxin module